MIQTPRKPGDTRTIHEQVEIGGVSVDAAIAPLLVQLWRRGYITDQSCQGGPQQPAYVQFTELEMALKFIAHTVDRLYDNEGLSPRRIQRWRLRVSVVEVSDSRVGGLVTFNPAHTSELVAAWEI